jgi:hypothetical protein
MQAEHVLDALGFLFILSFNDADYNLIRLANIFKRIAFIPKMLYTDSKGVIKVWS